MTDARFIALLAQAVHQVRPDWQTPGITAELRAARHHRPLTDVAAAMLRRAANPANLTPRLQPADLVEPTVRCPHGRGAFPHGRCAGCHEDAAEAGRLTSPATIGLA